ncbi:DUF4192 domain-containing protein [Mycobacterium intracellulare]|uniref:DUF4192 domain-containing protein n=1 Tax=Mycobacterium intracellulare TaxID=1767 RepID=UPI0006CAA4A9|nr:DUF4192 domain-containing protein [Mycobacterium intracellulare]KPN46865.1 hypothetical protein AN933_25410 [Mycobacterium intracellulare subsp. chimaera]
MTETFFATPADAIAAVPALIGFTPTNSVVAYMLRHDINHGLAVRSTIRFDVTITAEQATAFPATCNLHATDTPAAILIVICGEAHDTHARIVLDALRDALREAGIHVLLRLHTRNVTDAGQWLNLDTAECGPTYPYTDAILTAHQVHNGERISACRADIEAEFDPITPAPPVEIGEHCELVASTSEEIAEILSGHRHPSPTLPTRAGILITAHPALRDAMLHLALEHASGAADLWTHIARHLRGAPRAEALAVAGVCFCLHGDTVRAGIATDAALDEAEHTHTPAPRLAALMLAALQSGIGPSRIRDVVANSAPQPRTDQ